MNTTSPIRLGLLGFPLSHSLSPLLHQAALQSVDLAGSYHLFEIDPEDHEQQFPKLLSRLQQGAINGLNVTIPYKEKVIPFLDQLTPQAAAIGAVNTLFSDRERLIGDNTDAIGFLHCLDQLNFDPNGRIALVFGAGGAARAVIYSLLQQSWKVILSARSLAARQKLSQDFANLGKPGQLIAISMEPTEIKPYTSDLKLVVNATPLGMSPNIHSSPWPFNLAFPQQAVCLDLVYNPSTTLLMEFAQQNGSHAQNGMVMLVEQAAVAFKLWTGRQPDTSRMRQQLLAHFAR